MARLKILTFPDPRLRKVASPVKEFNKSLIKITENMLETMYEEGGIGLAATQVDIHERIVVMDLSEEKNEPRIFINPEFEILDDFYYEYDKLIKSKLLQCINNYNNNFILNKKKNWQLGYSTTLYSS